MAKETIQAKIKRLEDEKKKDLALIQAINQEILSMQEKEDKNFENSSLKNQLEDRLAFEVNKAKTYEKRMEQEKSRNIVLSNRIDELEGKIKHLENKLSSEKPNQTDNTRNAGRKPKLTGKQIVEMQMFRAQGMTLQAIQKETGISYGLVQKYCKIIKK